MGFQLVVAVECTHAVRRNIGTIIRCAAAMGASTILVIGNRRVSTHGSHGAQTRVNLVHFYEWNDAIVYLQQRADKGLLYGVSRHPGTLSGSIDVDAFVFEAAVADNVDCVAVFVVGNREWALSAEILHRLDAVLHVSLPDPSFLGRFHFDSILTICMHTLLQRLQAVGQHVGNGAFRPITGQKFILDETVNKRGRVQRGRVGIADASKLEESGDCGELALESVGCLFVGE